MFIKVYLGKDLMKYVYINIYTVRKFNMYKSYCWLEGDDGKSYYLPINEAMILNRFIVQQPNYIQGF